MINISTQRENNIAYLSIKGDVDASSSIHLDEALLTLSTESEINAILVDGSELDYISSAGLGVFMSYIDIFKAKEVQLIIYGLSTKVLNVFQILGLDQILIITKDKAAAQERLHEVQS